MKKSKDTKAELADKKLLEDIAKRLNTLVDLESGVIGRLADKRVSVGSAFKEHPTATVSSRGYLGLIGVLNGLRKTTKYTLVGNYERSFDPEELCYFSVVKSSEIER